MTRTRNNYGLYLDLPGPLAYWHPKVEAALQAEGFGILTEIDVQATLKAKLGEDVPPKLILGACIPPLAHQAMCAEPDIGLLLPCNVTLRELPDGGTRVGVLAVKEMMAMVDNPALSGIASAVTDRFERVLAALETEA